MNWNYPFTKIEYFFIIAFFVLSITYIGRTIWVARTLDTTSRSVIIKFFLRIVYFGLLIVSLLGPFFGEPERELLSEGKDIYFAIDISKSMDAVDVKPSRLEKVKFEIQHIVSTLSGNRFGLIAFASEAFQQVPLTSDSNALNLFLESLSTNQTSNTGTDICAAIDLVVDKEIEAKDPIRTTKVLVLFTDGENFGTCERSQLARLRQYGIYSIFVGVGTQIGGRIQTDEKWLTDENSQAVYSRLDAAYLQKLASQANGQYFEISNTSNSIGAIIKAVDSIANRSIDTRSVLVKSNRYQYFLVIALLLLIVDLLVTITTFEI